MTTLRLPRLAGTRGSAAQIVAEASLADAGVILDFTGTESAAQGFCDELVKQLSIRGHRILRIIGDNDRAHTFVTRALRLRQLPPMPTVLSVPPVAVTRWAAEGLAEGEDFDGGDVILDFSDCLSVTQGFCDEIVRQIADLRDGTLVAVTGATEGVQQELRQALRLRGAQEILAS